MLSMVLVLVRPLLLFARSAFTENATKLIFVSFWGWFQKAVQFVCKYVIYETAIYPSVFAADLYFFRLWFLAQVLIEVDTKHWQIRATVTLVS